MHALRDYVLEVRFMKLALSANAIVVRFKESNVDSSLLWLSIQLLGHKTPNGKIIPFPFLSMFFFSFFFFFFLKKRNSITIVPIDMTLDV